MELLRKKKSVGGETKGRRCRKVKAKKCVDTGSKTMGS